MGGGRHPAPSPVHVLTSTHHRRVCPVPCPRYEASGPDVEETPLCPEMKGRKQNRGVSRSTGQAMGGAGGSQGPGTQHGAPRPGPRPALSLREHFRVVSSQQSGMAGVVVVHAVEDGRLVFRKLAMAQV